MRVAILTTDNREPFKQYEKSEPWFGTAPEALIQGFGSLPDAVEIHVVSCIQQPVSAPAKLANNIWFHSLHVPKIGWLRTGYQGCIRAVLKKLKEIRPDIVHGQGTERDCAISAVFSGFPSVLTIHGNMRLIARIDHARPFSFLWLAAGLERFTLPRTAGIVCITNYTRNAVASLAKRTWVVPNAADATFFDLQANPDQNAPPVILCVANVGIRKNQNALIQALDPLAVQHKFKLVFLGQAMKGHAYDDKFFQLLASRPWCSYEGFADREKLKTYFQQAAALVLPSLEDNCPMAVLEAMAVGVPVVAAKVGGVPDLIEDGKTGLFCDPYGATSMNGAVRQILAQPEFARVLAAAAKCRAHERFHPAVIARRHLEIYREVLQQQTA